MSRDPDTESIHPLAERLNSATTATWVEAMLDDHRHMLEAVRLALPEIVRLSERVAETLSTGGRLILAGSGTSGRLAALEAAECPPTFGTAPEQIIALVAGGQAALTRSIEGAEDDSDAGARDLDRLSVSAADLVIGI